MTVGYEANELGLGAQFADQVQAAINTIAEQPSAFTAVHKSVRRALVRSCPIECAILSADTRFDPLIRHLLTLLQRLLDESPVRESEKGPTYDL